MYIYICKYIHIYIYVYTYVAGLNRVYLVKLRVLVSGDEAPLSSGVGYPFV